MDKTKGLGMVVVYYNPSYYGILAKEFLKIDEAGVFAQKRVIVNGPFLMEILEKDNAYFVELSCTI